MGGELRAFLLALLLFLALSIVGYGFAILYPSRSYEQFESVMRGLPEELSAWSIFIHNVTRPLLFAIPYILIKLLTRFRRNLASRAAAALPYLLMVINGFIVGLAVFVASHYLIPRNLPGCAPDSWESLAAALLLIVPHGVLEVPGLALLVSSPMALEWSAGRRVLAMVAAGVALLAAAALVEVYVTPLIFAQLAPIICGS